VRYLEQRGVLRADLDVAELAYGVGVGQARGAVREQIAELQLAEPCQRQVEAAELQFAELEAEESRSQPAFKASWLSVSR